MPKPSAALALVLLFALAPLAEANLKIQERSAVPGALPYVPQHHCEIVYDQAATERCAATGRAVAVTHVRVRIAGSAHVVGFLFDEVTRTDMASFECTQTCRVPVIGGDSRSSERATLYVTATAAPGAVVSVSAEWDSHAFLL